MSKQANSGNAEGSDDSFVNELFDEGSDGDANEEQPRDEVFVNLHSNVKQCHNVDSFFFLIQRRNGY